MSPPPAGPDARSAWASFPVFAGLASAVRFLRGEAAAVGVWAIYLPAVGLGLGVLWLATDRLVCTVAGRLPSSVAVVCVAAVATRAQPLLALGRLCAALASRRPLTVLESGPGMLAYGCTAAVVAAEVGVLSALDRYRVIGLAFAPVLGCCSIVVLAVGSRAARADARRLKFAPDVSFREFALATAATFALLFFAAEFLGLLLVLATAASTIAARVGLHRWIDGVNETAVLATAEAVQLIILALLAAL